MHAALPPPGSEPAACRDPCERRFGVPAVVRGYEDVYRAAAARPVGVSAATRILPRTL